MLLMILLPCIKTHRKIFVASLGTPSQRFQAEILKRCYARNMNKSLLISQHLFIHCSGVRCRSVTCTSMPSSSSSFLRFRVIAFFHAVGLVHLHHCARSLFDPPEIASRGRIWMIDRELMYLYGRERLHGRASMFHNILFF